MSEPLNNGLRSSFWLPVLMISVMVWIIMTGFEDFSSGYGFWFLFRFTVLKNWTNFGFVVKKFFFQCFFLIKKVEKLTKTVEKVKKRPKTIIKTVIFSVQVRFFPVLTKISKESSFFQF